MERQQPDLASVPCVLLAAALIHDCIFGNAFRRRANEDCHQ
jgi:hypothetical protein